LVHELNRLGVLADLSHVSDATAAQALAIAHANGAPVLWSHSSARAVHSVSRNVPDALLKQLGAPEKYHTGRDGKGRNRTDGVVMVNFAPFFVAPDGEATLERVADHVEHIGKVAGKEHVGLGSDFDGIGSVPEGLEDVSKYPALIAELHARGWSHRELAGLAGGNLLRVFEGAERAAHVMQRAGARPAMEIYGKRPDLPVYREDL
ncbi:GI20879, partial [Phellopilus nigrolimitatus]